VWRAGRVDLRRPPARSPRRDDREEAEVAREGVARVRAEPRVEEDDGRVDGVEGGQGRPAPGGAREPHAHARAAERREHPRVRFGERRELRPARDLALRDHRGPGRIGLRRLEEQLPHRPAPR